MNSNSDFVNFIEKLIIFVDQKIIIRIIIHSNVEQTKNYCPNNLI